MDRHDIARLWSIDEAGRIAPRLNAFDRGLGMTEATLDEFESCRRYDELVAESLR